MDPFHYLSLSLLQKERQPLKNPAPQESYSRISATRMDWHLSRAAKAA